MKSGRIGPFVRRQTGISYLVLMIILVSCENDQLPSSADRNVVSDQQVINFEELTMLVNVRATDSTYLVVSSIDSINIYINDMYWAKVNSQYVDTTKLDKINTENRFETKKKLNYLIIAEQDTGGPEFTTAGDFAQYLNAFYEVHPGEYVCWIESFQVTYTDNTTRKYYPFEYRTFSIALDSRSSFVGEIELNIE